jgi:hypothetical protein
MEMELKLPQHCPGDGMLGDTITLNDDGTFSISGYDGITVLTKEQASDLAKMLLLWAESGTSSCVV